MFACINDGVRKTAKQPRPSGQEILQVHMGHAKALTRKQSQTGRGAGTPPGPHGTIRARKHYKVHLGLPRKYNMSDVVDTRHFSS